MDEIFVFAFLYIAFKNSISMTLRNYAIALLKLVMYLLNWRKYLFKLEKPNCLK